MKKTITIQKKWHDSGKDSAIPVINPDNSMLCLLFISEGEVGVSGTAPFKGLNGRPADQPVRLFCPMQPKLAFPGVP